MLTIPKDLRDVQTGEIDDADRGIDLLAIMSAFVSEWRLALIAFLVVAAACLLYVFSLKPQYVATAAILPQETHTETGTLAALFSSSSNSSGSLYIGLLHSRSVQDSTIDYAHLLDLFHMRSRQTARATLAGKSSFAEGGDGIMYISVRDENAADAAKIANAYLYGLQHLNQQMALQQNRELSDVFQKQLDDEETALTKSEQEFETTQRQTGLVQPETQTQMSLSTIAGIRSQITGLQVQLATLLQSESEGNPEVQRVRSQIAKLQAVESSLVNGSSTPLGEAQPTVKIPQTSLKYQHALRDVTLHNELMKSLASQYEQARLNGNTARPSFQIVDLAVPPETQSWPPRKPYIIFSIAFAVIVSMFLVLVKLLFRRVLRDPEHRESLTQLRRALRRA